MNVKVVGTFCLHLRNTKGSVAEQAALCNFKLLVSWCVPDLV